MVNRSEGSGAGLAEAVLTGEKQITKVSVSGVESWVDVDERGMVQINHDPTDKALQHLKKAELFFSLPFDQVRLTRLVMQEAHVVKRMCAAEWNVLKMVAVAAFMQGNEQMPELLRRQIIEGIVVHIGACIHMSLLKIDNYAFQLLTLAEFKPSASEII